MAHRDQLRRDRSSDEVALEEYSRTAAALPHEGTYEPFAPQDQVPPASKQQGEATSAALLPPVKEEDSKAERRVSSRSNKGIPPDRFSAGV